MARVLVVDDEELMREAVRLALEQDGHEIFEAENGMAGLRLFAQQRPDVVITDLIMPQKEGIETIRDLRKKYPDSKIIALSGRGGISLNANLERAIHVGADAALLKPCDFDELRDTVKRLSAAPASETAKRPKDNSNRPPPGAG
jgi:DNA-binding response OmpR family regulator